MDTVPVLAERTASIELAGEAEKAITAKPEALEPGVYNEVGREREVETPPQEDERGPEALPRLGRPERRLLRWCVASAEDAWATRKSSEMARRQVKACKRGCGRLGGHTWSRVLVFEVTVLNMS